MREKWLALLVVLPALAACSNNAPPVARYPTRATTTSTTEIIRVPDEEACANRPWRPQNPPFAGPGPHLIVPITPHMPDDIAADFRGKSQPYISGSLERDKGEDPAVITWGDRLDKVQLLACIKAVKGAGPIGKATCPFDGPAATSHTFPLYKGNYKVTLREARTGRVASTLTIPGTLNGDDNCPSNATDTGHTVLLRALDWAVVSDKLRPLASAPAPPVDRPRR